MQPDPTEQKQDSFQSFQDLLREDELKEVFHKIDADKDKKISHKDLGRLFATLRKDILDDAEVSQMVQAPDFDRDGFINLNDFIKLHKKGVREHDIRHAFRICDIDRDGKISTNDLQDVLRRLGERCSYEECRQMVDEVDSDGDGLVVMEDFSAMMTRTARSL